MHTKATEQSYFLQMKSAPMAMPQESEDPKVMGSNPTGAIGCGHMVSDMSK